MGDQLSAGRGCVAAGRWTSARGAVTRVIGVLALVGGADGVLGCTRIDIRVRGGERRTCVGRRMR
jgi:hypothetical protein